MRSLLFLVRSLVLLVGPLLLMGQDSCTYADAYSGPYDGATGADTYDGADPAEAAARSVCFAVSELSCGDRIVGDTSDFNAGATEAIDGYPYIVGNYAGPELTYSIDPAGADSVEVRFIDPEPSHLNLDLFVIQSLDLVCHPSDTLVRGFNDVRFDPLAQANYFLVVDGIDGAAGEFEIEVMCD